MTDRETMQVLVNNAMETREVAYTVSRYEYKDGKFGKYEAQIPVFDSQREFIYENSDSLKIFSIGWVG